MRTLLGLSASPWTHLACFSLAVAEVEFKFVEFVPLLGERRLRKLAGQQHATVPLLLDDGQAVMGTLAIAEHLDARAGGAPLIPAAEREAVLRWHTRAETILGIARALVITRMASRSEVQRALLPPFIPGPARPLFGWTSKLALTHIQRKYGFERDEPLWRDRLAKELDTLTADLRGRETVLSSFSFADIAIAAAIGSIAPTPREWPVRRLAPAVLACWTDDGLKARFGELLSFRDRIYERHRPR